MCEDSVGLQVGFNFFFSRAWWDEPAAPYRGGGGVEVGVRTPSHTVMYLAVVGRLCVVGVGERYGQLWGQEGRRAALHEGGVALPPKTRVHERYSKCGCVDLGPQFLPSRMTFAQINIHILLLCVYITTVLATLFPMMNWLEKEQQSSSQRTATSHRQDGTPDDLQSLTFQHLTICGVFVGKPLLDLTFPSSNHNTTTTSASRLHQPNPFAAMAKDWDTWRATIINLYKVEGRTLKQVRETMAEKNQFHAS